MTVKDGKHESKTDSKLLCLEVINVISADEELFCSYYLFVNKLESLLWKQAKKAFRVNIDLSDWTREFILNFDIFFKYR